MTAVIPGLLKATLRPMFRLLSLPLTAMTLGLFLFVINSVTLWLAAWITENVFDAGLVIDGLLPAIFGSIIVSVVSTGLSFLLPDVEKS
jgi:putative membrane protein